MTSALHNTSQKGFTLVELLIVITILGILATVLLVAINPLEQIGRGRDAGRQSAVAQLGHVMSSYFTSQQLSQYPAASTSWQAALVSSGDINSVVTANSTNTTTCLAGDNQGNVCYAPGTTTNTNDTALIWTPLESQASNAVYKARQGTACGAYLVTLYNSAQGHQGYSCLTNSSTAPTTSTNIY